MWQNYYIVANIEQQTPQYRTALFLNTIGLKAMDIYNGFEFENEADKENLDKIIEKFDEYSIGEINETYERYLFNKRDQQEGETFNDYIAALRILAQTCNFCACLRDTLLRDRIVLGIRSSRTRKRLLEERNPTLKKCIDTCKSDETAHQHLHAFQPEANIHGVGARPKSSRGKFKKNKHDKSKSRPKNKPNTEPRDCKFCGNKHILDKSQCPAYGAKCNVCGNRNHFAKMCKTKSVKSVQQETEVSDENDDYEEYYSDSDNSVEYINVVTCTNTINNVKPTCPDDIYAEMLIKPENKSIHFQVDCGAKVNTIPQRLIQNKEITHRPNTLRMWNNATCEALGTCRLTLQNPRNKKKYSVEFVVVKDNLTPLLGSKASQHMGLITVNKENISTPVKVHGVNRPIDGTNDSTSRKHSLPEDKYTSVFKDELGELPGEVHLEVDPSIDPVVEPPRRIPHAIKHKVKSEVDKLVQQGVLTRVTEPTRWVSQLVTSEKKNGDLRVCIDPRPLNKAIKRPHYQLPVLEDILPELAQAKIFSKLDLKSAFWQVKLDYESSLLTTFQVPGSHGRFRWNRLPFGTSASSEIFQQKIHTAL